MINTRLRLRPITLATASSDPQINLHRLQDIPQETEREAGKLTPSHALKLLEANKEIANHRLIFGSGLDKSIKSLKRLIEIQPKKENGEEYGLWLLEVDNSIAYENEDNKEAQKIAKDLLFRLKRFAFVLKDNGISLKTK